MYEILFSKKALDFVETLQESYKEKSRDALTDFKENPFSHPYRKIKGKTMFTGYCIEQTKTER